MASSSVSQESLDMDDFDNMARRNRIRTHRGRVMPHRSGDRVDTAGDTHGDREGRGDHQNGDTGDTALHGVGGVGGGDHESPTRSAAARLKEKSRSRANHLHKGKLPKDKRKLREKRRSTGVVHLPSTESTGDSLDDDDDDDESMVHETKKNTTFNEATSSNIHHHHHHHHHAYDSRPRGNKSPSDLEADLEDNQDYDSTVSHSETNLTLIGRSESSDTQMNTGLISRQPPPSQAKFSPESSRAAATALKYGGTSATQAGSSEQESNKTPPSSATTKSTVSALVSRYTQGADSPYQRETDSSSKGESESPRGLSYGASKDLGSSRTDRGYGGYLSSRFHERDVGGSGDIRGEGSVGGSRFHTSRFHYQSPRPFASQVQQNSNSENTAQLERQLEKEKEENKKLQQQLEQKDRRIAELERQVALLNKECDELDEDNLKLQEENKALIRAMSQLGSKV